MMTALEVAQYFVEGLPDDEPASNVKIQALLYFAQGYCLAMRGEPLFEDEIQAWDFGPCVPSVYQHFKDLEMPD